MKERDRSSRPTMANTSRPTTANSRPTTASTSATTGKGPMTASQSAKMPKGTKPPPKGWQEHLDPTSGRTFYVHLKSNKTTWVYPIEKMPSRGLARGKEVRLSTPVKRKTVQQDWRGFLPEPYKFPGE